MAMVQKPRFTFWLKNSVNSEAPMTISGVVSGMTSMRLTSAPPFMRYRDRARATSAPRMVAAIQATVATFSDSFSASM
jgi:hypothetical protein